MKKIKVVLMTAAVLTAAVGVFATRPCLQCEGFDQYIPNGQGYIQVGELGVDYDCEWSGTTCTYYRPDPGQPNIYAPCRVGAYTEINPTH